MGGGSGVRAGYEYKFPKLLEPFATELRIAQEKHRAFQMEIPFPKEERKLRYKKYSKSVLGKLKGTENWSETAVEHLFLGEIVINPKTGLPRATGFHYAQIRGNGNNIIRKRMSKTDANGIYQANVIIRGVKKQAFSSFFPRSWSPQDVVNAVNEAYKNKIWKNGMYEGVYNNIKIKISIDENQKIKSAFPIKEGK